MPSHQTSTLKVNDIARPAQDTKNASGYSRAEIASAAVLIALAGASTGFLLWATAHGFDIWDEGFYLIMSRHPHDIAAYSGSYYFYTGLLFSLTGMEIQPFRNAGVLLLLLATIVLACGLRSIDDVLPTKSFNARGRVGFVALIAFVFLGTLVYYGSFANPTPSYNLLTSLCLTAATGTTLLALSAASRSKRHPAVVYMFITGALVGLQFFAKAPPSVLMSLAVAAVVWLWPATPAAKPKRFVLLLIFGLGVITWALVHFATFEGPQSFVQKVRLGLQYHHELGVKQDFGAIRTLAWENFRILGSMAKQNWPAVIILAILLWSYKALSRSPERYLKAVCWLAVIGIVATHLAAQYHIGGHHANVNLHWRLIGFYFFWAGLLLAALVFLVFDQRGLANRTTIRRQDILVMGLLAAIPFIASIGTSNPQIGYNYTLTLAPWFGLLAFLTTRVQWFGLPLRIPAQLAIASFVFVQLLTGYLGAPYGSLKGVRELRTTTIVGDPPTSVLLDQETHDAIETLKRVAAHCAIKPGDRMLGFYGVPGIVYALGGRVVMFPAFTGNFWETNDISARAAEKAVGLLPYDEARDAILVTRSVTFRNAPEVRLPDLSKIGRKFPDDYQLCGEAVWPFSQSPIRLWKPTAP